MKTFLLSIAALGTAAVATPASATVEVGSSTGCASGPLAPTADKCAGYFSGNTMSGQSASVAEQQTAINQLLGAGQYTVDWNALQAAGKVVSGSDLNALNALLATAGGQVSSVSTGATSRVRRAMCRPSTCGTTSAPVTSA